MPAAGYAYALLQKVEEEARSRDLMILVSDSIN